MPDYRLYPLNAAGRIGRPVILTCDDDKQAISRMAETETAHGAELWEGLRLVLKTPLPEKPNNE